MHRFTRLTLETQVRAVYAQLLQALQARALIDIFTGKRNYTSMLLQSLSTSTNEATMLPKTSLGIGLACLWALFFLAVGLVFLERTIR